MFDAELDALPTATPRKLELLSGLAYRNAFSRSALWLLPLFLLPLILLIPLVALTSDPHMKLGLVRTQVAAGHVVSVAERDLRNCRDGRQLVYAFNVPSGAEYRSGVNVCSQSPSYRRKEGDIVPVLYSVSNPANNDLDESHHTLVGALIPLFFFPVFIVLIFASIFLPQIRPLRRARKLFRQGRLARASVVFVKKRTFATNNMSAYYPTEIYLRYDGPGGKQEAKALCSNDWLLNQLVPDSVVHIAYLPEKPAEAALLEAYFR